MAYCGYLLLRLLLWWVLLLVVCDSMILAAGCVSLLGWCFACHGLLWSVCAVMCVLDLCFCLFVCVCVLIVFAGLLD